MQNESPISVGLQGEAPASFDLQRESAANHMYKYKDDLFVVRLSLVARAAVEVFSCEYSGVWDRSVVRARIMACVYASIVGMFSRLV